MTTRKQGRPYTVEMDEQLRQLAKGGHDAKQIARALDRSQSSVRQRAIKIGVRVPRAENFSEPYTIEMDGRLRELAQAGRTAKEIATTLDRSPDSVRQRAIKVGASLPKGTGSSGHQRLALALLERKGPMHGFQLARELGIPRRNTWRVMRALTARGQVHVLKYERGLSGPPKPVYTIGPGENATRPKGMSRAQVYRRYRQKMKTERPDEYRRLIKRSNALRRKPRADIAAAWIKGRSE